MKTAQVHTYALSAIYGAAMAAAGINWKQPAFWIGMTFGVLMALNEAIWRRK